MSYFKFRASACLFIISLMLVLSACATSGGGTVTESGQSIAPKNTSTGDEAATRTYESDKGTITLPEHPRRVVVAVGDYVGDVLALGITPVGAPDTVFDTPYYKKYLNGVENIGDSSALSLEKVTALKPDLIITYDEKAYENLKKIAPTVFIPYGKYQYKDRLMELGKVLNKEQEAKNCLADFATKIAEKKQALSDVIDSGKKIAIFEITGKELYLYGKSYGRGGAILYDELGLHAPEKVEKAAFEKGWASISIEALPEMLGDADYLMLGIRGDGTDQGKDILSKSVWKNLSAIKSGKVYQYSIDDFYFQDPIALTYQLELISDFLVSKK
ncbi:iron-hydroxamate ABC transporter substrate-binding protein [Paenibacillus sp. S02]|uniref:iron-hydroxamate ABC transporter substrate-binding protein n=1 Tax=Paenibacillus sp. S02 TaxID=2823904 RepID=UPI001C648FDA|nr:iron-hydroxamate ABC transporter substrate-binding protein [Paenibacillus sp. S02]QYK68485.1 Iron(3+)-hydroxamate-binding protein FhuD [Paenibacillus sp. S02]